jgi:hypothetical protein
VRPLRTSACLNLWRDMLRNVSPKKSQRARSSVHMNLLVKLVFGAQLAVTCMAMELAPSTNDGRISQAEVAEWALTVRQNSAFRCTEQPTHEVFCDSEAARAIWVFTLPGHAAHPAFVARKMTFVGGELLITSSGRFAGSADAYQRWLAAFRLADQRMLERSPR